MRIDGQLIQRIQRILHPNKVNNQITRISFIALIIFNNCLITTILFSAKNIVVGIVLSISILVSSIMIDSLYAKHKLG